LASLIAVTGKTFGEAVRDFIADRAVAWKGGAEGSEAKAYRRTLLGSGLEALPLAAIDTAAVLATVKSMPSVTADKALEIRRPVAARRPNSVAYIHGLIEPAGPS
jgi:hypothetical protein